MVRDVEVDGDIFVGGDFSSINGAASGHLARIRPDGTWVPWADAVPDRIYALTVDGGRVYSAAGGPGGQVYAHDATTGSRLWRRHGDGDVQSIDYLPTEGSVVAGGHFLRWAGVDQRWAVELQASNGAMTSWRPTFNRGPWAVHATQSELYLGGRFTRISGVAARRFARWALS
jgi:outer membrane protein assembly factor BamB